MHSNFAFLEAYWPDLAQIGAAAEDHLHLDPGQTCALLAMFGSRTASHLILGENLKLPADAREAGQIKLLRRSAVLPPVIDDILYALKRGAARDCAGESCSVREAGVLLKLAYHLGVWFAAVYGDEVIEASPFLMPEPAEDPGARCALCGEQLASVSALGDPVRPETAFLALPRSQRTQKANAAALELELSDEELQHLAKEKVRLESDVIDVVNYALQQNRVSIIRNLTIINNDPGALEHLDLHITSTPELSLPFHKHIDYIPGASSYDIRDLKLLLNGAYLAGLTERCTGVVHMVLQKGDTVLCREDLIITALAFDQWHGSGLYPELLAAFVTPNHPEVSRINARAAQFLEDWTSDPSLDAYQTKDPNRVLAQAGAVYAALQEQNIVYAVHPASFERTGQRVRLCDAVLQQKMGTCLDLTLLYASCLEAIGLHPILLLQKGHIFAGVWLEDLSFPESIQDDVSLITKRLASGINEIAVCECTCFTAGQSTSFDTARSCAEQKLVGTDSVEYIIDITRTRLSGIVPLPQRILSEKGWETVRPELDPASLTAAPDAIGTAISVEDTVSGPMSRQTQWERKLLDLGLRNQLINMRLTKTTLPLLSTSLEELEDALTSGSDFSVLPRPGDWTIAPGQVDFETIHDLTGLEDVISSEFKNKRLRSVCTEAELNRTVKELYRASRSSLEENGANTLYLALGLLRWYETPKSTKARYAPVVLLPVDLIRKSAAQGYIIRLRDDEPQMNITMLEKMKQDFQLVVNGLDPLPADEQGIDIRKVFTILRKAVMGQARWDVLESAYLGIFSFSQFVMWNDIRNRSSDLKRNKIVRSLMDGRLCWDAEDMVLGKKVPEDNVFLPLSADASQLFAIEAASAGESFVLHGPPGTGKSQTITAMIANALAQNKTVLFVAEKMAALEVVQKRLDAIGIGAFCLELHSNKSKKRTVLEQLRQATEVTKSVPPEAYAQKAGQIAALRRDLDVYADALHTPLECGMTVFGLISRYEQLRDAEDADIVFPGTVQGLTAADLDLREAAVERLIAAAREIGHPKDHPLTVVTGTHYSQNLRQSLGSALESYRAAMGELESAIEGLAAAMEQPVPEDHSDLKELYQLSKILLDWMAFPRAWGRAENLHFYLEEVCHMARCHLKTAQYRRQLQKNWNNTFLTQNADALAAEYHAISRKWFLPRALEMRKFSKRMAAFAKGPVNNDTLGQEFALLGQYQAELRESRTRLERLGPDLEFLYRGEDTDWNKIISLTDQARLAAEALHRLGAPEDFRMVYAGDRSLASPLQELVDAWDRLKTPADRLNALLGVKSGAGTHWIQEQRAMCDTIEQNAHKLKEWITWNSTVAEIRELGLGKLAEHYCRGCDHAQVMNIYRKSLYQALAMLEISRNEALNAFSGAVFNEKIAQLKRLDAQLTRLTREEIFCRLAAKVPSFAKEAAHSSEVGILQRAIRSGGRGISIRKLFEQIPSLLPRLCPCMLMSPISAAQYLDPRREPFHIVVFDEASQLTTSKAVGALARGENAIIVGDPKQMPPTSFFATNTVDEENLEMEDLESILDDCLALNMPQTHLLWHYRSRHESLIAFSNSRFYENKLYTFPSVNDRARKVSLVPVDGVFERGKNRCNRAEAEAVVEELRRRCHDPLLSRFSVGVVTFNISQQNLIDDLLTEACKSDPVLEKWACESEEPVFIKNLENVQGDERDVILFSIGYGPDEKGKIYMNFGPLNRDGGWRRLNVAVSRSRQEMIVFSSLRPDQINLSRTAAEGVAALKEFLEYAAGRELPQNEHTANPVLSREQGIAEAICAHLALHGYDTDCHVGHSQYRIDVGIADPDNPEEYLLGILLDGESYGASKTTRDREIAQIGVLGGLGWQILRIWSMDWWDNREKELQRILQTLEQVRKEREEARILAQEAAEEAALAAEHPQDTQTDPPEPEIGEEEDPSAPLESRVVPVRAAPSGASAYQVAALKPLTLQPDEFLLPKYKTSIQSRIRKVMAAEAPISENLLIRRVLQSYGISRSGSRIHARMNEIFHSMGLSSTQTDAQRFYWNPEQDPEQYNLFRAGTSEDTKRDAKDIPIQEAANAVCFVLYEQGGLSREDLVREAARVMGYTRTGSVVTPLFEAAIFHCVNAELCRLDSGGRWALTDAGIRRAAAICTQV